MKQTRERIRLRTISYRLNQKSHDLLCEALRRWDRFTVNGDLYQRQKTITEAWTGLGTATTYKAAVDAGLMEYATDPNPGHLMWWKLTEKGAAIVQAWYESGFRAEHIEGNTKPAFSNDGLYPEIKRQDLTYLRARSLDPVGQTRSTTMEGYETEPADDTSVTLCKHCDHFIEKNDGGVGTAAHAHLDDGEQEYDHEAEPGETKTIAEWQVARPDLFKHYPDGSIGPNSDYHSRIGKSDDFEDQEVIGLDNDGKVVQWDENLAETYNSGETPQEIKDTNLTDEERSRVGPRLTYRPRSVSIQ